MAFLGPGWRQPKLPLRFLVVGSAPRRAAFGGVVGRAYAGGGCGCPGQIWIGRVLWPAASTRCGLRRQGHMHASHLYYATVVDGGRG